MSKLLSAEIHAVYWPPLTARAWRILNWLRAEKAPRSRYAIAETVKIPPSALTALAPMLLEQGFVREVPRKDANSTYAPLLGLTKRGRIAGRKRLPHSLIPTRPGVPCGDGGGDLFGQFVMYSFSVTTILARVS